MTPSALALNQHIEDYLSFYIQHPAPPGYAVLLKGLWGSGKTWFVNNFVDRNDYRNRVLFVSLYGVTSFEEIEAEFYRQLHPVLSSKGMMLAGRVMKGFLKGAVKIDLSKDVEGTVEPVLPDLKLPEYLTKTSSSILIFDDVERCSIEITKLLGYINHFVEQGGYRAILVANEDEIAKRPDATNDREHYERVKEKLIGKTFVVQPDSKAAITSFLAQVQDSRARTALERCYDNILQIYVASKSDNLRHIRQMLLDIDRLIPTLGIKVLGNRELISHFICLYLIYSIEVRNGAIKAEDITSAFKARVRAHLAQQDKPPAARPAFMNVVDKYGQFPLDETLLEASLWKNLLDDGLDVSVQLNEALVNSSYFQSEERPPWVKLWHHHTLDDEAAEAYLAEVASQFDSFVTDNIGEVRHMFGLLLTFSKMGIYRKTTTDILETGKRYVDHLKDTGKLPLGASNVFGFFDTGGAMGLGYSGADLPEFRQLNDYLSATAEEALEESRPADAATLLEETIQDSARFYKAVVLTGSENSRFYNVPIFTFMDPQKLVNVITQLNGKDKRTIGSSIEERYRSEQTNRLLDAEKPFLEEVSELLKAESERRTGKLSGHDLSSISNVFANAALKLLPAKSIL